MNCPRALDPPISGTAGSDTAGSGTADSSRQAAAVRIFLGLGSNLGDRGAHLDSAERELECDGRVKIVRRSSDHDTAPVGPPQPRFLNRVVEIRTSLSPRELLATAKQIEQGLGRTNHGVRWGPREIDIDLLAWDGQSIDSPELTLPHREISRRTFVLEPWREIAADYEVYPGQESVEDLWQVLASEHSASEHGHSPDSKRTPC